MEALLATAYTLTASFSWTPCIPKDELIARISAHPDNQIVMRAPDVIVRNSRHLVLYRISKEGTACNMAVGRSKGLKAASVE